MPDGEFARRLGVSVFDLDRTLTRHPTYSAFLLGAAFWRAPWRLLLLPLLLPHGLAYRFRLIGRKRIKEAMQRLTLGTALVRGDLDIVTDAFVRGFAARSLFPQGRSLVAAEAAAGRRVVLATAAPAFYAAPIALSLGIADVVATQSEWHGDRLLARIDGENCHGPDKLRMLRAFLAARGLSRDAIHVRFFSDDMSDLPTFEWCDEPIVVNPGKRLQAEAAQRGWPVLDWRVPAMAAG